MASTDLARLMRRFSDIGRIHLARTGVEWLESRRVFRMCGGHGVSAFGISVFIYQVWRPHEHPMVPSTYLLQLFYPSLLV